MNSTEINFEKRSNHAEAERTDGTNNGHNHSAEESLAAYSNAEKTKALRKLDWNIIPLLFVFNMLAYIDRGNIGNAYTAGMGKEWNITSNEYSWLITAYYLCYIGFHWFILLWKLVSLPTWVALMACGWGAVSMLQAAMHSFAGMMALRCLLGAFEAGYAPGVALFLSFFYSRSEMGLRYGLFLSSASIANCFASALAHGIVHARTGLVQWRLLFIIEGIPTILIAPLAYFFLPNGPVECRFLGAKENEIVRLRAVTARGHESKGRLDMNQVCAAFYDYKNYLQAVIVFCLNAAFAALPAFLPTIIKDIGYSSVQAQGLSAPPYFISFLLCLAIPFLSDKLASRAYFLAVLNVIGAVGYLIQALVTATAVRYFATFLICAGVFPAVSLAFTWVTDNQGSASKRGGGLVVFGMLGQAGSIAGSRFFPEEEGPYYVKGMGISAGLLFFAAIVTMVLRVLLGWENKKRDGRGLDGSVMSSSDEHPEFRFIL